MIYLIEPYNAYQKPPKKKHWTEIAEEEALLVKIQLEEAARQKVIQDAQRQDAIRQLMAERDAAANSNLNNQNLALPQYQPQPAAQQVQNGQYAAPAGGGGWVLPTEFEKDEFGDFSVSPSSGVGPLIVTFTNLTPTPENDSFLWDLGSGSLTSTDITPAPLTYTQTGSYTVTLYATSQMGFPSTTSKTITVADPTIFAWISSPLLTSGTGPLSRSFTVSNSGTAPNSTVNGRFDFGDGSPDLAYTASGMNSMTFVHIYDSGSLATASLALTESGYGHTSRATVYVSASIGVMSPSFTVDISNSIAPFSSSFTNTSTNTLAGGIPYGYEWVVDDVAMDSTFNYAQRFDTGSHTVRLDMSESYYDGRASFELDGGITGSLPTLSPSFTVDQASGVAPLPVTFSNASTQQVNVGDSFSYNWVFGDGSPDSSFTNPMHLYNTGTFAVRLDMSESLYNVTNSYVLDAGITGSNPTLVAGFTFNSSSEGAGPDYEPMTASITSSITYNGFGNLESTLSFISESVVIESFYNFTNATTYITAAGAFTASMYVTESSYGNTSSYDIPFVVQT